MEPGEIDKTNSVTENHGIYTALTSERVTEEAEIDECGGQDQSGRGRSGKAYQRRRLRRTGGRQRTCKGPEARGAWPFQELSEAHDQVGRLEWEAGVGGEDGEFQQQHVSRHQDGHGHVGI